MRWVTMVVVVLTVKYTWFVLYECTVGYIFILIKTRSSAELACFQNIFGESVEVQLTLIPAAVLECTVGSHADGLFCSPDSPWACSAWLPAAAGACAGGKVHACHRDQASSSSSLLLNICVHHPASEDEFRQDLLPSYCSALQMGRNLFITVEIKGTSIWTLLILSIGSDCAVSAFCS